MTSLVVAKWLFAVFCALSGMAFYALAFVAAVAFGAVPGWWSDSWLSPIWRSTHDFTYAQPIAFRMTKLAFIFVIVFGMGTLCWLGVLINPMDKVISDRRKGW